MKKLMFAGILFVLFTKTVAVSAQEYQDLLMLYVDEKYDKCLSKCEKYTESDKTKNDALPFLYASMCLYEMSKDHKYITDYPNAYADALAWAGKYRKKDKSYTYKSEALPFIEKLKHEILEEIDNAFLEGTEKSFKKALGTIKKILIFDPECIGTELLRGEIEILLKNKAEGTKMVIAAMKKVDEVGKTVEFGSMSETQQIYLKFALMTKAKLTEKTSKTQARDIMGKGHQFFYKERPDQKYDYTTDFKEYYDKL
jgi:antitoxin component HigA of HigAB toxin-antitoxin module